MISLPQFSGHFKFKTAELRVAVVTQHEDFQSRLSQIAQDHFVCIKTENTEHQVKQFYPVGTSSTPSPGDLNQFHVSVMPVPGFTKPGEPSLSKVTEADQAVADAFVATTNKLFGLQGIRDFDDNMDKADLSQVANEGNRPFGLLKFLQYCDYTPKTPETVWQ